MLAKTIWLLLLCFFSCEFVMAFEGLDGAQVSSTYHISSIFQQIFVQ
jgi:hypothetical protein